jgi:hypothetical protein
MIEVKRQHGEPETVTVARQNAFPDSGDGIGVSLLVTGGLLTALAAQSAKRQAAWER